MNNSTERPPYPDQETFTPTEPISVESPTPEAIEVRQEEDKSKIEALHANLVQSSAEVLEKEPESLTETIPPSSVRKTPRWLRKATLFAGILGFGLGSASATERPTKDDMGKKVEKHSETKESVTDRLRQDWNDYVDWLEKKGLKGDAKLDEGDLGLKMIDQYRAEHPETSLSNETVGLIQEEFATYRTWALDQIKQGKAAFAPGVTEETFMKNLSDTDGYAGQFTTNKKFPTAYLQTSVGGASRTVKYAEFSKADTFVRYK